MLTFGVSLLDGNVSHHTLATYLSQPTPALIRLRLKVSAVLLTHTHRIHVAL